MSGYREKVHINLGPGLPFPHLRAKVPARWSATNGHPGMAPQPHLPQYPCLPSVQGTEPSCQTCPRTKRARKINSSFGGLAPIRVGGTLLLPCPAPLHWCLGGRWKGAEPWHGAEAGAVVPAEQRPCPHAHTGAQAPGPQNSTVLTTVLGSSKVAMRICWGGGMAMRSPMSGGTRGPPSSSSRASYSVLMCSRG